MAYIRYKRLWESKFDNIVCKKKEKLQGLNINQLKLQAHDAYHIDKKLTTKFEAMNDEDVTNKVFLHE